LARRRFFVDSVRGGVAELRGEEARHLARVLRAEAGQQYEITDSRAAYLAEIQEASAGRVLFRVIEPLESPEPPACITVLAALIKFDRFEWMIEKATELGVERIIPVAASRSEKGLAEASRKRMERWTRVARESSQQARRLRAPEILPAARFEAAVAEAADHRYFLEESEAPPLLAVLPGARTPGARLALLVGPEGGWTDVERELAGRSGWQPASLGPLILRAETAAMAAVAILMNAWVSSGLASSAEGPATSAR
jgi:16S rRNA (uracil1498-N3)-methyltransferase